MYNENQKKVVFIIYLNSYNHDVEYPDSQDFEKFLRKLLFNYEKNEISKLIEDIRYKSKEEEDLKQRDKQKNVANSKLTQLLF